VISRVPLCPWQSIVRAGTPVQRCPRAARSRSNILNFHQPLGRLCKHTSPMPSPGNVRLINISEASRNFRTLLIASPAPTPMLPERSSTSATAERGPAIVLATILIVQVWPVSMLGTSTVPLVMTSARCLHVTTPRRLPGARHADAAHPSWNLSEGKARADQVERFGRKKWPQLLTEHTGTIGASRRVITHGTARQGPIGMQFE
jgi:hypothetical protein